MIPAVPFWRVAADRLLREEARDLFEYAGFLRSHYGDTFRLGGFVVTFDPALFNDVSEAVGNGSNDAIWPLLEYHRRHGTAPFSTLPTGEVWKARRTVAKSIVSKQSKLDAARPRLLDYARKNWSADVGDLAARLSLLFFLDWVPSCAAEFIRATQRSAHLLGDLFFLPEWAGKRTAAYAEFERCTKSADDLAARMWRTAEMPPGDAASLLKTPVSTGAELALRVFYLLGRFPHTQKRMREPGYQKAFYHEMQRFLPVANGSMRRVRERACGVDAGSTVVLLRPKAAHDGLFLPERWLGERVDDYRDLALGFAPDAVAVPMRADAPASPFGEGPRQCIASVFVPWLVGIVVEAALERFRVQCTTLCRNRQRLLNVLEPKPELKFTLIK